MTAEVGKACNSGEEVLALKKFISKCSVDNEKLKDVIAVNKNRDDFLLKFRWDGVFTHAAAGVRWQMFCSAIGRACHSL
jgi:hypothetical protein